MFAKNKPYGDKTVMVCDNGLSVELAILLSKSYGKVYYYCPWKQSGYPKIEQYWIGRGINNIESIEDMWDHFGDTDLFYFTDIFDGDVQIHLQSLGKLVYGTRNAQCLETNRVLLKDTNKQLGLPVIPYEIVNGIDNLRKYLQSHDNTWIKISSTFRGSMETFKSENYELTKPYLDQLEVSLGPISQILQFLVEDHVQTKVEAGIDTWFVNGEYPKEVFAGIEIKNKGYISRILPYNDIPNVIKQVNDKYASVLNKYGVRGQFSTEVRIDDKLNGYFTDATMRNPYPPSNLMWYQIQNWDDIIWNVASGNQCNPKFTDPYGVELSLTSTWAKTNWLAVSIPPQFRDNVKIYNLTYINNKPYVIPNCDAIGSVVATGKSIQEAIDKCLHIADQVNGWQIDYPEYAIKKAKEEINEMDNLKINFFK